MNRLFISVLLTLLSCSGGEPELIHVVDARTFTLNTPEGWILSEGTGYDTYVGKISGPLGTIYFDQGLMSFGALETVGREGSTVYRISLLVDGLPAILHKATINDNSTKRTLITLYVDAGDQIHRNRLYVFEPGPVSEGLLVSMMKTHRFK